MRGIKEGYLGRQWQFDIGEEYKAQYFCKPGHENELLKTFIARRIMYTRMLVKSDEGGPLEVHLIMARAPLAWRTILVLENIKSTSLLYTKASEHQESLLAITRTKPSSTITTNNLVSNLRKLGYTLPKPGFQHNFPMDRGANLTIGEPDMTLDLSTSYKELYLSSQEVSSPDRPEDQILAEVYQVLKKRQRAPPPGGYMFSKNDHVTTKMGRLPPSPCKCCGSSNHWDKECPDYAIFMERTTKSGYIYKQSTIMDDEPYQRAYGILLSQCLASMQVDEPKLQQGFEEAVHFGRSNIISGGCKSGEEAKFTYKATVEQD